MDASVSLGALIAILVVIFQQDSLAHEIESSTYVSSIERRQPLQRGCVPACEQDSLAHETESSICVSSIGETPTFAARLRASVRAAAATYRLLNAPSSCSTASYVPTSGNVVQCCD
jgi:hypothetical protein